MSIGRKIEDEREAVQYLRAAERKGMSIVAAKLRPFRGTLTADAERRFNDVFASGHVLDAGWNAHGRRKFRDAEATQPVLAAEGGAFLGAMYAAVKPTVSLPSRWRRRLPTTRISRCASRLR